MIAWECVSQTVGGWIRLLWTLFYKSFGSWINKYLKLDLVSYLTSPLILVILTAVACTSLCFNLHLCPPYDHYLGENFYYWDARLLNIYTKSLLDLYSTNIYFILSFALHLLILIFEEQVFNFNEGQFIPLLRFILWQFFY